MQPHGGAKELAVRLVGAERAVELSRAHADAPRIVVSGIDLLTVRRFGDGLLTPLVGPMTRDVWDRVLDEEIIIANGDSWAWGVPIAFPLTEEEKAAVKPGQPAIMVSERGEEVALLEVEDVYAWDKARYCLVIHGSETPEHPGARQTLEDRRGWLAGGNIHVFPSDFRPNEAIARYTHSTDRVRALLKVKGWSAAIAMPARRPLRRDHEYAMVVAAERLMHAGTWAGVVLTPLASETRWDDVPAEVRIASHAVLKEMRLLGKGDAEESLWRQAGYTINDVFDLYALEMRTFHGGPREAVMHAIYRQNMGFTHIIIGHGTADPLYDSGSSFPSGTEARAKFESLAGKLLIEPIFVGAAAYFEELGAVALIADHADRGLKTVTIPDRKLRELLRSGVAPDERIMRPEVGEVLSRAYREMQSGIKLAREAPKDPPAPEPNIVWHSQKVTREMRENQNRHRGVTLWFTGLSGSGKSTLANEVSAILHERGVRTYVLDGDNIRMGLSKGLGFGEEDRKENIRRIAEVARLFSDAGIVTLAAFISPFRHERDMARALQPETFVEVHVKADLAVCEQRDPKGLYRKARAGQIKDFTGIGSPYEPPAKPELVVDTGLSSLKDCAEMVVAELEMRAYIPNMGTADTRCKEL